MESVVKSKFVPSVYQAAIYDFIQKGQGNAVISAVAGSGKSTTIVNALDLIDLTINPTVFLAFNKSIVEELATKVPQGVLVKTLHAIGFGAINKAFKTFKPKVESRKYDDLLKLLAPTWDLSSMFGDNKDITQEDLFDYTTRVRKLVDLARVNLVDLDNPAMLEELAEKHEVDILNGEAVNALAAIKIGNRDCTKYDFADMIYIPVVKDLKFDAYKFVFVDECQDLNKAQQAIVMKLVNPNGGRFIAVGDPAQAIYGFAGADAESFNNLKNKPNTIELPLSVCYRCGIDIIKYAQSIVPHLSYPEGALQGLVKQDGKNNEIQEGDYVLCRNTAPLVILCLRMLSEGKKAMIMGGDIGKNLIGMIRKTKKTNIDEMFVVLDADLEKIKYKLMNKKGLTLEEVNDLTQIVNYNEKVKVLEIISSTDRIKTTDYLIKKLDILFSDTRKGIIFSTIHKSKGLEADRVHIICKEMMPSKYAKKSWQKVQESNLQYVAYTRAKKELIFNTEFNYNPKSN